ncbi:uncharacterized protein [Prorops nasuta]|uniref:uncharacterized protein isoform X2 n=1 Tax=Prorops nasuta TaxID=863751 RepID=UPI0034CDD0A5
MFKFLLVGLCLVWSLADASIKLGGYPERMESIVTSCREKSEITEAELEKLPDDPTYVDENKYDTFHYCVMREEKLMNEDTGFNKEEIKHFVENMDVPQNLNKEHLMKVVMDCVDAGQGKDLPNEKLAGNMLRCITNTKEF